MSDVPDGEHAAVVDRIEDGLAALEIDADDGRYELLVDPSALPSEARHANAAVTVEVADGSLVAATYRPEETDARLSRAQSLFDRIARRPPGADEDPADGDDGDDDEE
ncbi:DUF3006 domain-containing protein [Halobaculum marinum]|uniref:DUF3006 domain-containing protein n=1 Tax=Halobaculum marinum TaxID=3031996 RepID=A0ABD5WU23_9EURY|nr:DUF3006 domain-containing protein [Halobaculum sp. DT55]